MAKKRKTISVEFIKEYANAQLANPNNTIEEKMGIITMIEKVLHESNSYNGYMYLSLEPNNQPPALGTEGWSARKYF
jgi:hypothetical protein